MGFLALSCVPLAYLTKSLMIPAVYLCGSALGLYLKKVNEQCYFCHTYQELNTIKVPPSSQIK